MTTLSKQRRQSIPIPITLTVIRQVEDKISVSHQAQIDRTVLGLDAVQAEVKSLIVVIPAAQTQRTHTLRA
jgi:hypothetical protein